MSNAPANVLLSILVNVALTSAMQAAGKFGEVAKLHAEWLGLQAAFAWCCADHGTTKDATIARSIKPMRAAARAILRGGDAARWIP